MTTLEPNPLEPTPLRVVVCGDNAAVPRLLHRCGFTVLADVELVLEAMTLVEREHPDVVVVDIASCGILGLGVLPQFAEVSPKSVVIVLSPYENTLGAALQPGEAVKILSSCDLRPLLAYLEDIQRVAHVGLACPCCAGPTTAPALDAGRSSVTITDPTAGSRAALVHEKQQFGSRGNQARSV